MEFSRQLSSDSQGLPFHGVPIGRSTGEANHRRVSSVATAISRWSADTVFKIGRWTTENSGEEPAKYVISPFVAAKEAPKKKKKWYKGLTFCCVLLGTSVIITFGALAAIFTFATQVHNAGGQRVQAAQDAMAPLPRIGLDGKAVTASQIGIVR